MPVYYVLVLGKLCLSPEDVSCGHTYEATNDAEAKLIIPKVAGEFKVIKDYCLYKWVGIIPGLTDIDGWVLVRDFAKEKGE